MKKVYTKEMLDYIREVAPGKYSREITELVNERFGTNFSQSQICYCMRNHHIKNGMFCSHKKRPWRKITTPEMDEFIRANNYMTTAKDMADMLNKKFGTSFTPEQIKAYRSRNSLDSGLTGYFTKGHVPQNKGKKVSSDVYAKAAPTMFKKGHIPQNHRPIGSERIDIEGYTYVKVAEPKEWKLKHRLIWEEAYGPIPEDKIIVFKNQNKQDIRLENLMMISRSQSSIMSHHNLWSTQPELTELGANTAELIARIEKKKKETRETVKSKNRLGEVGKKKTVF